MLTYGRARELWQSLVSPGDELNFRRLLLETLERLFNEGAWAGSYDTRTVLVEEDLELLPTEAGIIKAQAEKDLQDIPIQHSFNSESPYTTGLIDCGKSPEGLRIYKNNGDPQLMILTVKKNYTTVKDLSSCRWEDDLPIFPDNLSAIKNGMYSTLFAEQDNMQRAMEYWAIALDSLNSQFRQERSGTRVHPKIGATANGRSRKKLNMM